MKVLKLDAISHNGKGGNPTGVAVSGETQDISDN
jgi:hypothetical protein